MSLQLPIRAPRGLSLVETMCTMAIVAVLLSLGIPQFRPWLEARQLEGSSRQLVADLRLARTEAVARGENVRFAVQASRAGTCYLLHTGAPHTCRCDAEGPPACQAGATLLRAAQAPRALRLESNVESLLFDSQRGTVSPTGTLRLLDREDRELRAVVNVLGRVRLCASGLVLHGVPAC